MTRLTWKKHPREHGLAGMFYILSYDLNFGPDHPRIAIVAPTGDRYSGNIDGYYWYCGDELELGLARCNTARKPVISMDQAKADCHAYVSECLRKVGLLK